MLRNLGVLLLLVAAVGCKGKREQQCEEARDREMARMAKRVAEGIGDSPPDMRARIQAQADEETERTRTGFVRVCKQMRGLDLACFDDEKKAETEACRDALKPFWEDVLGPIQVQR